MKIVPPVLRFLWGETIPFLITISKDPFGQTVQDIKRFNLQLTIKDDLSKADSDAVGLLQNDYFIRWGNNAYIELNTTCLQPGGVYHLEIVAFSIGMIMKTIYEVILEPRVPATTNPLP